MYIIVGNKKDLVNENQIENINSKIKQKFSYYQNILATIFTSAKKDDNIRELIDIISKYLINLAKRKDNKKNINDLTLINLAEDDVENKNNGWLSYFYGKC